MLLATNCAPSYQLCSQLKEQSETQEKLQQQRDQEKRDFACEQDRNRKEHELAIMTKQIEMEKERLAFMEKEKLIHKLEPWRDGDKPETFFKINTIALW